MSEGSPRFVTQMLHTTVWFAGMSMPAELFGRCVALSEAVPLFDVARECLRALSPRKRLETGMKHTVRKRGTKGREFAHGELADAVAYRDRLRVAGTLADFGRYVGVHPPHADRSDHASVLVTGHARVLVGPDAGPGLMLSATWHDYGIGGPGWPEWAPRATEALFEWFVAALQLGAVVVEGSGTWLPRVGDDLRFAIPRPEPLGEPVVRGYRTLMYLPPWAVATLGGVEVVVERAPVSRAVGLPDGGMATLLCLSPSELTVERLTAWREFLLPVTQLPEPDQPNIERARRPMDLLESDWPFVSRGS